MTQAISDATLTASLEGDFTSHRAEVNGVELHYVGGGQGDPLVLLPGWPQTWWQFHKIMPALARAYASADAIRAGNSWYQSCLQDIEDEKDYEPITKPLLALAGDRGNYAFLDYVVPKKGTDVRVVEVKESGHYFPEEQPETVIRHLVKFFG